MTDYYIDPLEQVERLNKLAEIIESRPEQFDMSWWWKVVTPYDDDRPELGSHTQNISTPYNLAVHETDMLAEGCKTRGCVAGWATSLWAAEVSERAQMLDASEGAKEVLGLDYATANWLFDADAQHQKAYQAAEVLRDLAAYVMVNGTSEGFIDHGHRTDGL